MFSLLKAVWKTKSSRKRVKPVAVGYPRRYRDQNTILVMQTLDNRREKQNTGLNKGMFPIPFSHSLASTISLVTFTIILSVDSYGSDLPWLKPPNESWNNSLYTHLLRPAGPGQPLLREAPGPPSRKQMKFFPPRASIVWVSRSSSQHWLFVICSWLLFKPLLSCAPNPELHHFIYNFLLANLIPDLLPYLYLL